MLTACALVARVAQMPTAREYMSQYARKDAPATDVAIVYEPLRLASASVEPVALAGRSTRSSRRRVLSRTAAPRECGFVAVLSAASSSGRRRRSSPGASPAATQHIRDRVKACVPADVGGRVLVRKLAEGQELEVACGYVAQSAGCCQIYDAPGGNFRVGFSEGRSARGVWTRLVRVRAVSGGVCGVGRVRARACVF